ncbi:MAG TPA: hypothetical protein DCR40_16835 [Prolixibacteraceae bacterium]|nr:hypothetical protein [Prolixibacteraceae bacterium]
MKIKRAFAVLLVWCFFPLFSVADDPVVVDPCHYSTEGTDFWFGLMQNRDKGNDHYLEITVTSRIGADFTLTYGPNEMPIGDGSYSVAANDSRTIQIPFELLESKGSENTEGKGIHLQASNPVNVYALNYRTQSSDVAVIYPTKSLGTEYYAMCYMPPQVGSNEKNSEFLIVASENDTKVTITPSVNTAGGKTAGIPFTISLSKGQSFQVQSLNNNITGQGDLTGTYISSDKPIAFFSGSKATPIPVNGNSYDHLYEQMPPTSTWGRVFYIVPLASRLKDTYRVLAADDATVVTIEGLNLIITLNRGQYFEFELDRNQASRLISTKRVLLAQYCRSQNLDNSGVGDPFMIILSPVTQKIDDVTFVAYESALIQDIFYINITSLTSEINHIILDDAPISSQYIKAFPKGEYSYARVPVSKGTHRLYNDNKDGGFLAFVYGFGDRTESYGYGVGYNLDIQLDIEGDIKDDTLVICKGDSYKLDAGDYFINYKWSTGETGSTIVVTKEGWYTVIASAPSGCTKSDKVYVKVEDPKIDLGEDKVACYPGEIILDAGPEFEKYLWQDGSTDRTFRVLETGDYSVTATNERGCNASASVRVSVFDPVFSQNYEVASVEHPAISFFNETENSVGFWWDFGDGATSNEENPVHHYSAIGKYRVVFQATSKFGCADTTSSTVKIIPFTLSTPNAFRPESEIAENRVFLPITEGIDPEKYHLRIFNRVGSTVFESKNPETGWDGKMKNGTLAESGVFVWIVQYADVQGYAHQQKGTVMLVR